MPNPINRFRPSRFFSLFYISWVKLPLLILFFMTIIALAMRINILSLNVNNY